MSDASLTNLRKRVEAWERLRDVMVDLLSEAEYDKLGDALVPFVDRDLHALARLEQGDAYVPYPHPHDSPIWTLLSEAAP